MPRRYLDPARFRAAGFHATRAVMNSKKKLLILGDGRFAVEAFEIAEAAGDFSPVGFVNSLVRPRGRLLEGLPVFWLEDVPFGPAECEVICAIVTTERRPFIELMRARGYRFASLIHPFSNISRRARIAPGCIVNAGAVIGSNAVLSESPSSTAAR